LDFVVGEGKEHGATRNNTVGKNRGSSFTKLLLTYTQGVENTT